MSSNLFDLSGRVALVTGGSRGIGRAIANGFAGAGASIALCSRTEIDLRQATDELRAQGATAEAFAADASSVEEGQRLVRDVLARLGQIDILVNVAGANRRRASTEITEDDWDAVVGLNLKGLFFISQAVGRYWIQTRRFASENNRGKGKIINLGSIAGEMGIRGRAPYTASKSGVVGLTRTLAVEWAREGVCVNCIAPGYIETELTKPLFNDPNFIAAVHNRTPMGRHGYVEDVVGPALFLASRASDYVTGQTIIVDGGQILPESLEALAQA